LLVCSTLSLAVFCWGTMQWPCRLSATMCLVLSTLKLTVFFQASEELGSLVQLIIRVVLKMRHFLFVLTLALGVFSVGFQLLLIPGARGEETRHTKSYGVFGSDVWDESYNTKGVISCYGSALARYSTWMGWWVANSLLCAQALLGRARRFCVRLP